MSNSDSVVGLRYRGLSTGMPSVSRFRSGHMPSGMNVTSVIETLSESEMDTCSDSEGECYGTRYSPESSPQDDKVPSGSTKYNGFLNGNARRHGAIYDDSSESLTGSEMNSTPPRSNNGISGEKRLQSVVNASGISSQPIKETVKQGFQDFRDRKQQNKPHEDDIPTAPPMMGSYQQVNVVPEKLPMPRADANSATSSSSATKVESNTSKNTKLGATNNPEMSVKTAAVPSQPLPARFPTFHASGLGYWYSVLSYDACVRLCLHSWARGCMEAPAFLENECALLRDAFGLKHILLQSEEELLKKDSSELVSEGASVKTKKTIGKIKVQVRKVKMGMDPPTGCTFSSLKSSSSIKLESLQLRLTNVKSIISSERRALKTERVSPIVNVNGSLLQQSMTYVIVGTRRYAKEVPKLLKIGLNAWRSSTTSYEMVQESYTCLLRSKSSSEDDAVRMHPGSGETRVFLPDGLGDDLIIEVHDSKGKYCGHAVLQVADIADESGEKLRHCFIYREPEHEQVGKIQLYINYTTTLDENSHKCGSVAETIAYDCVLETAMKIQQFQQRNLSIHGSWRWLLAEFASYFGVSDAYTKLRYCKTKNALSHQEVRILGEVSDQIEQVVTLVFENYKSLDESTLSGIMDVFRPATGEAAPALVPALKLFKLLNDILSPEVQTKICRYFQNATKKRSKMHLAESEEFVSNNNENILMDPVALSTAYKKMKSLCLNLRNEILTDIEIHKQDLLPSFIDLPNLSSSIYSTELYSRLRAFLVACPPSGPTPPVVELVIAAADFQRDLALWNISHIKGGVDAKELFHVYITLWIQDKRLALLELCKFDKVKSAGFSMQHSTTTFVDDIYARLKEMLAEYDVIISRWPEYTFTLENAIADVEKAVVERLEKQYAEVLSPLKENAMPMKFGLKYVQKLAKGNLCPYNVSAELGIVLNSMKRMLDVLRPQIEAQLKMWVSCIPESGNMVAGESLSEVTVMIRSKFRNYVQSVTDKLIENTKLHNATKLKKIIQNARGGNIIESDLRHKMQPLKEMLATTINQLHDILETQVFVIVCRGFWDRMGQDVLKFLEDRKENRYWHKASRVAATVLDDTFASQMQQLLGNALQEKDLEPPRSILEVRSMLCKDAVNHKDNYYY
ncbi:hypothetical protein F511_00039 [Dorcoceras hygrometricum]|nr:hypothetical protein F511_00039 [Dorcoceras hygrometricum]